jgi:hypothetical protein
MSLSSWAIQELSEYLELENRENYTLAPQITTRFESSPTNCQHSDSGPPNYQNLWKMHHLAKYPRITLATCHFSIKKNKKVN